MHIFRLTLGALALQAATVISVAIEQPALEVPRDIQARGTIATTATTPTTPTSSTATDISTTIEITSFEDKSHSADPSQKSQSADPSQKSQEADPSQKSQKADPSQKSQEADPSQKSQNADPSQKSQPARPSPTTTTTTTPATTTTSTTTTTPATTTTSTTTTIPAPSQTACTLEQEVSCSPCLCGVKSDGSGTTYCWDYSSCFNSGSHCETDADCSGDAGAPTCVYDDYEYACGGYQKICVGTSSNTCGQPFKRTLDENGSNPADAAAKELEAVFNGPVARSNGHRIGRTFRG